MRCKAIHLGIYQGARVRPGQEFEFTGKQAPTWAEVLKADADEAPKALRRQKEKGMEPLEVKD